MRMMRKSLMAGAVALLATTAAPGIADAAPCAATTLNNWLVAGFSCTVTVGANTKTFSNFSYSPDGFTAVPATVVGVAPSFTPDPGIVFNAGWTNTTATNLDALISFTVTEGPGSPAGVLIRDAELLISGIAGAGGQDVETFFTAPGGTQIGTGLLVNNATPSNTREFTPNLSTVFVVDDLTVFPGGSISVLSKEFSQSGAVMPEPASLAILGVSLLGMGAAAYRRRRK